MTLRSAILILVAAVTALAAGAAPRKKTSSAYIEYIEKYAPMAVEQQKKAAIPASITLAQALLESAAGQSTLATQGNNHFGIKCGDAWDGDSMLRDDDAPDECFRVYDSPAHSYDDHSRFLKRKRYQPLFALDPTDYAAWARMLSKCGYATDPNYADRLITIIETYSLYRYDSGETDFDEIAEYIIDSIKSSHPVRRSRKLHYVIAAPGDSYGDIAREFSIPLSDILKFNDSRSDAKIKPWQEVYLQEKHDEAPDRIKNATIGEGESMHSLSQRFGMKLSTIRKLNPGVTDTPGKVIRLR